MTHPTPTAAPKAPPLPLRGEGMGVGGHHTDRLKFRPGPEPGPRSTREVPGQARDGVALALALLPAVLASAAAAQVASTGTAAADILLSQAIAEHRVFLTCSALDPATHAQITANWQRDVAAAAAILSANQVPPEAIAAFTTAAEPRALLPGPDTPFEDLRQICDASPDWQQHYFQLNLTILELKLPQAFE